MAGARVWPMPGSSPCPSGESRAARSRSFDCRTWQCSGARRHSLRSPGRTRSEASSRCPPCVSSRFEIPELRLSGSLPQFDTRPGRMTQSRHLDSAVVACQGRLRMAIATGRAAGPEMTDAYARLEEKILERDQVAASGIFYDLVRAGRPLPE